MRGSRRATRSTWCARRQDSRSRRRGGPPRPVRSRRQRAHRRPPAECQGADAGGDPAAHSRGSGRTHRNPSRRSDRRRCIGRVGAAQPRAHGVHGAGGDRSASNMRTSTSRGPTATWRGPGPAQVDYSVGASSYSFLRELPGRRQLVDGGGRDVGSRRDTSPRDFGEYALDGEAGWMRRWPIARDGAGFVFALSRRFPGFLIRCRRRYRRGFQSLHREQARRRVRRAVRS